MENRDYTILTDEAMEFAKGFSELGEAGRAMMREKIEALKNEDKETAARLKAAQETIEEDDGIWT